MSWRTLGELNLEKSICEQTLGLDGALWEFVKIHRNPERLNAPAAEDSLQN